LPAIDFMKLHAGSQMIDKGTNVGLPFVGAAPDLGAFEFGATTTGGVSGSGGRAGTGGATATGTGGSRAGTGGAPGSGGGLGTIGAGGVVGTGGTIAGTGGGAGAVAGQSGRGENVTTTSGCACAIDAASKTMSASVSLGSVLAMLGALGLISARRRRRDR
jgi:hypothetical protein